MKLFAQRRLILSTQYNTTMNHISRVNEPSIFQKMLFSAFQTEIRAIFATFFNCKHSNGFFSNKMDKVNKYRIIIIGSYGICEMTAIILIPHYFGSFFKICCIHHIFLRKQISIIRASNLMNSISSKRWNVWINKLKSEYFVYICIHWSKEGTIE